MCFFFLFLSQLSGNFSGFEPTQIGGLEPQIGPGLNHKIGSGTFYNISLKKYQRTEANGTHFCFGTGPTFSTMIGVWRCFQSFCLSKKFPNLLRSTVNSGVKSEAMSVQHRMGGRYTSEPWSIGWVMEILGGQWLWAIDFLGSNMFFTIGKCWSPNF